MSELTDRATHNADDAPRVWRGDGDCFTCGGRHPEATHGVCEFVRDHMLGASILAAEMTLRRKRKTKRRRRRQENLGCWVANNMRLVEAAREWHYWYVVDPDKRRRIEQVQGGPWRRVPSPVGAAARFADDDARPPEASLARQTMS